LVTSGKASIGMLLNVRIPDTSNNAVQKNIKYRFFKEKAIMLRRSLFIF
jgi:hypothetical protein